MVRTALTPPGVGSNSGAPGAGSTHPAAVVPGGVAAHTPRRSRKL
ncbi:hypothetical protein ATN83_3348 [Raoultella ornithinolytica]|nr:hypothetical protein ATN83_3348 [Raoultella ornithinolytica]